MADEKVHASSLDIVKILIVVCTAVGLLVGGATWAYQMTQLIATKSYHEADQDEFEVGLSQQLSKQSNQLDNIEANAVVQRLLSIIDAKCNGSTAANLDLRLFEQLQRYRKLMDSDFTVGPCPNDDVVALPTLP